MANHRSLRDEQELLLMPRRSGGQDALSVAAMYGANASGKSTVLDALGFVQHAVRDSYQRWSPTGPIPRKPFLLDEAARTESSWYVLEVLIDGARWTYGFELDDKQIIEEWLYTYPQQRRRVIFERDADGIRFGTAVANRRDRARVLTDLIRDNALLLSLAAQAGLAEVLPMYEWLNDSMEIYTGGGTAASAVLADFLIAEPQRMIEVTRLLGAADFGVTGLQVDVRGPEVAMAEAALARAEAEVERTLDGKGSNVQAVRELESVRHEVDFLHTLNPRNRVRLQHGSSGVLFEVRDESAGTKSWMALIPLVLKALTAGDTLVVDEIDTSLHPRLVARVIELFRDPATNTGGGQLVFTTHDATLLGTNFGVETLRRDEIWFVEKAADGTSSLFALSDFKPRKGENTERRYLGGSYGAVPAVFSGSLVHELLEAREHGHAAS
ncbi:AAA family ATPase [Kribbella solani]|uniref:AAA family ATPase n=1 Tax=Kribbella solani TaxID=236067 RepID=UPI0029C01C22|nr:ATP-binding protein [Kribbella solani]